MSSILDFLSQQQSPDLMSQPIGNPKTISTRIQQWLGATPETGQDQVSKVLSMRQKPSINDIGAGLRTTLRSGKETSGQDYADARLNDAIGRLTSMQKLQNDASGQNLPAALQLANEYQNRLAAGDTQGANLIAQFAKTNDKGIQVGTDGTYAPMAGYGAAVGAIGYDKKYGEQSGKNQSDLGYGPRIKESEKIAVNNADQTMDLQKKASSAANTLSLTQQAREVLNGVDSQGNPLLDESGNQLGSPTGSGLGSMYVSGKAFLGQSDPSTKANARLDIIAGNLLQNVPRMEGPQSDYDVKSYKEQAGKVGDRTVPIGDRLEALREIERIQQKYANVRTPSKDALGQYGRENPLTINKSGSPPPSNPQPGSVIDGYVFQGGNPADPNSWVPQ